jgi:hypothetical protein
MMLVFYSVRENHRLLSAAYMNPVPMALEGRHR